MSGSRLLLLGQDAEALAPRLEASGYIVVPTREPIVEAAKVSSTPGVDLVVLSASEAHRIAVLRQQWPAVPMLLDVADDTLDARVRCLTAGADDFWLSNHPPSDLLMRVRLHLELKQRHLPATQLLQVADLSLNATSRQVKRGSRAVTLTAREFQLLLLLLERQGTVVSRDQILAQVWNDECGASSNVIEVYVRYLRQKLEKGGERRLIHTIRGQGYCLAEHVPPLGGPR